MAVFKLHYQQHLAKCCSFLLEVLLVQVLWVGTVVVLEQLQGWAAVEQPTYDEVYR